MDPLPRIEQLVNVGRYRQALECLDICKTSEGRSGDLLRAEILEGLGRATEARHSVDSVLHSKHASHSERARAEFIVSRLYAEGGDFDAELKHLQRAIVHADKGKDLKSLCVAQLRLFALLADRSGPDSARGLLKEIRSNVSKLGDPITTAALHLFVAELEGKRGLLTSASNHTLIAQRLLDKHHHLWFEAWAHNNLLALAVLMSDFESALNHGKKALSCSTECGAVASIRRCLGNLGRLHLTMGELETALDYLRRALDCSSTSNEQVNGTMDSIARVHLLKREPDVGLRLMAEIEATTQPPNGTGRYVHRHSLLTKAELLSSAGRNDEASKCLDFVIALARQASDEALLGAASLLRIELQTVPEVEPINQNLMTLKVQAPVELHALFERVVAWRLMSTGSREEARNHFERAKRLYEGVGNVPGQIQLERSLLRPTQEPPVPRPDIRAPEFRPAAASIQSAAALTVHASHPEILATELVALLEHASCVTGAQALARDERGHETTLAAFGTTPQGAELRRFTLGSARQRTFEVRVQPLGDIESQATLNAVSLLLETVHELERAREDREERLTLWPLEQLPSGDDAVILGEMETLLSQARRIAQTNVVVLITGESGTGKEVLARAIHGFSPRSRKAFVPFNCSAIARDLAESQLFGHRRGAFTGADRDMLGLVRTAKDGTLFLDEVGEMALDLQPKLLRFLESGEISPLGESTPFTVDVRIIAATNAHLETLVEHGRFREDLYYRLNVVRLTIPPLRERRDEIPALVHHFVAKAAAEFGKERVRVAEETMEQLLLYSWPGNVRQLQNELRRIVALADHDAVLQPAALSVAIRQETEHAARQKAPEPRGALSEKLGPALSRIEREMIKAALSANQGRLEATAKALGISRKGLYLKRQRLGV